MAKKYIISAENAEEIKEYRKRVTDKYLDRRLHAIQLLGEGKKAKEIAEKLDADKRQISMWAAKFCKCGGIEGFVRKVGGRIRENMSFEEEAVLLEQFKIKAEKGQIVETSEIKAAYEKAIGHKCGSGQIYYVLHRHGWSKKMPRSKHPQKASEEAIEASKKLKQKWNLNLEI